MANWQMQDLEILHLWTLQGYFALENSYYKMILFLNWKKKMEAEIWNKKGPLNDVWRDI